MQCQGLLHAWGQLGHAVCTNSLARLGHCGTTAPWVTPTLELSEVTHGRNSEMPVTGPARRKTARISSTRISGGTRAKKTVRAHASASSDGGGSGTPVLLGCTGSTGLRLEALLPLLGTAGAGTAPPVRLHIVGTGGCSGSLGSHVKTYASVTWPFDAYVLLHAGCKWLRLLTYRPSWMAMQALLNAQESMSGSVADTQH